MNAIYTIKIFNDGRFCWEVSKREKTLEDYQHEEKRHLILFAIVIFLSIGAKIT